MEPGQCTTHYNAGSRYADICTVVHKPGAIGVLIMPLEARVIMIIIPGSIKLRGNTVGICTPACRRRFLISFHRHVSKIIAAAAEGVDILGYYKDQLGSVAVLDIKIVEKVAFQLKLSRPN